MRLAAFAAITLLATGCSQEDRQYLLTYEKPSLMTPPSTTAQATAERPATVSSTPASIAEPTVAAIAPPKEVTAVPVTPPPVQGSAPTIVEPVPAASAATSRPQASTPVLMAQIEGAIEPQRVEPDPLVTTPHANLARTAPQSMPPTVAPATTEKQAPVASEAAKPTAASSMTLANTPFAEGETPDAVAEPAPVATPPPPVVQTERMFASGAAETRCRAVAKQRKEDARANGYDEDAQGQIFEGTFKNCMRWEQTHS